jgi:hypothetical protein
MVDYLWHDGNSVLQSDAQNAHIGNNRNAFESTTVNWMEETSAEVTCVSMGIEIPVGGGNDPTEGRIREWLLTGGIICLLIYGESWWIGR